VSGLRLALTLLTVAPLRAPRDVDRRTAGSAMLWAPVVGLLLGLTAALVLTGGRVFVAYEVRGGPLPAVAAVGALAVLTRGLHLDGLADTADGLGVHGGRQRSLAVMARSDIGPFGVVTLVLVLLTQVVALRNDVALHRGTMALVLAVVTGRLAVTLACTPATPAARADGLGALVAGSVPRGRAPALAGVVVLGAAGWGLLEGDRGGGRLAVQAVVAVLAGLLAAAVLRRRAVRRLGGITGDVLGALVEVTTLVVLVVLQMELPSWVGEPFGPHG
jgi:adenosylcobinamide-GDP ribazoletransferase